MLWVLRRQEKVDIRADGTLWKLVKDQGSYAKLTDEKNKWEADYRQSVENHKACMENLVCYERELSKARDNVANLERRLAYSEKENAQWKEVCGEQYSDLKLAKDEVASLTERLKICKDNYEQLDKSFDELKKHTSCKRLSEGDECQCAKCYRDKEINALNARLEAKADDILVGQYENLQAHLKVVADDRDYWKREYMELAYARDRLKELSAMLSRYKKWMRGKDRALSNFQKTAEQWKQEARRWRLYCKSLPNTGANLTRNLDEELAREDLKT